MIEKVTSVKKIEGEIIAPGDKSISHRVALFNSIASGTSKITNFCVGDDKSAILNCLIGLGAQIEETDNSIHIQGNGLHGLTEPVDVLNAGNSGTTIRLVSGLLSGNDFYSVITGDKSLRNRPMKRIITPLMKMGAIIYGREKSSLAPLTIIGGNLTGIEYEMPVASAQLKSCLLIAGLYANDKTIIHQPGPSRDHTEKILESMGAQIKVTGTTIQIQKSELSSVDMNIPSDTSNSTFWIVAGCCHPNASIKLKNVGMNPTRTGMLEVLNAMGAKIKIDNERYEGGEPVADISVESSELKGIEISGEIIPRVIDELPILALAACFADGKTLIKDSEELRVKESDRIKATVDSLSKLGAQIEETEDGMLINGGAQLVGAEVNSFGDHRIAMTNGIAGLIAKNETTVINSEAADISYPSFWETLKTLGN
ncbi:MAG: 3-phosphoshikimate 1-carboxyvinyltransferase [Chloroflexi bacterium]|nr:3-phosphoshikimate 1-carboxyvinyltransferase [Chloroflexota bacterium]